MGENKSFVRVEQASTTLELRDMSQWSLAKVWVDRQGTEEMGRLGMDLKLDAKGELNGKVTNDTINDLTEVVLVVGAKPTSWEISRRGSAPFLRTRNKSSSLRAVTCPGCCTLIRRMIRNSVSAILCPNTDIPTEWSTGMLTFWDGARTI